MLIAIILVALIFLVPGYTYIAFFALCTAKKLLKSGVRLTPGMRMACRIVLFTGYPADIIFNQVQGRIEFGEWRGTTFTSRIKYYYKHPDECPDPDKFNYWYELLELADPGHVDGEE